MKPAPPSGSAGPYDILFNLVTPLGTEAEYISQALRSGTLSGDNAFSRRVERILEATTGAVRAMLAPSCTAALEMSSLLLRIGPGDEVIMPTFTFTSTATAFTMRGARPVFADSRADTLNIDETRLEHLITPQTRALVVVHYGGVGCEMEALSEIASRHRIPIVEDNAHGLYGRYRGQALGTFGCLATQSFHETKNFTSGEGGAVLINDADLIERAEIVREKGTNRARFFRGEVAKYTWVDEGSSFLLSELQAAYLMAQLEAREQIQRERQALWDRYRDSLQGWSATLGMQLPTVPAECEQTYHLFYILTPSLAIRTRLIEHLRAHRILAVSHYVPLNVSPKGMSFGGRPGDCPVAESAADRLLRLPLHRGLSLTQQDRVIEALLEFRL